jgi:hypothetical protein
MIVEIEPISPHQRGNAQDPSNINPPFRAERGLFIKSLVLKYFRNIRLEEARGRDVEVIKVELPRDLAIRFRKYVAEKYGFRRGALSRAIADLIERELTSTRAQAAEGVEVIVGLGLLSDYMWEGEDLVEALRRANVPNRR